MGNSRTATDSLRGFQYQFELSIAEILKLGQPEDAAQVEGIEDIDLLMQGARTAVQCKYHARKSYQASRIRRPLRMMLVDFLENGDRLDYVLYVHFEDPKDLPERLSLNDLKAIFTFKTGGAQHTVHGDLDASNGRLRAFLKRLRIVCGVSYEALHDDVLSLLRDEFGCTKAGADDFYYSRALRLIVDLATRRQRQDGTVTRGEFTAAVDSTDDLFSLWFARFRGREEFLKLVRKRLRERDALRTTKQRALFLGREMLTSPERRGAYRFGDFIDALQDSYFKPNRSLIDAEPWTLILDADGEDLARLKLEVLAQGHAFFDGFEDLQFQPGQFDLGPVKTPKLKANRKTTDMLGRSSYGLRLISAKTVEQHGAELRSPSVLIAVAIDLPEFWPESDCYRVHIPGIPSLEDLIPLLKK